MPAGPMVDRNLDGAKPMRGREHRDEPVHARVERERRGNLAAKHLQAAVVVVKVQPREESDERVEHSRGERLVPWIAPRRLPAVDEIGPGPPRGLEPGEHGRNLGRIVLPVAIEHRDEPPRAARESGGQGGRLAEARGLPHARDPRIGGCCRRDFSPRGVGRAVVDDEQLPTPSGGVEHGPNLLDQRADVARFVAHRHDQRDVGGEHGRPARGGRVGKGCHRGRRQAREYPRR
jgi:hypothetical protein